MAVAAPSVKILVGPPEQGNGVRLLRTRQG